MTMLGRLAPANYLPGSVLTGRSMEARAADLDGDGHLDLIVAREHAPNILFALCDEALSPQRIWVF